MHQEVAALGGADQAGHRRLPFLEILLSFRQLHDVSGGVLERNELATAGQRKSDHRTVVSSRAGMSSGAARFLICRAAGFDRRLLRWGNFCCGLRRVGAYLAPWIGRALVGNVAERALVSALRGLIPLLLLWRLVLGFFPVFRDRLFLRVGRSGQHHNHRRGADNSHANTPSMLSEFLINGIAQRPSAFQPVGMRSPRSCRRARRRSRCASIPRGLQSIDGG